MAKVTLPPAAFFCNLKVTWPPYCCCRERHLTVHIRVLGSFCCNLQLFWIIKCIFLSTDEDLPHFYHADHVSRRGFQDCRWAVPLENPHIHLLCAVLSICGRLCRCLLRVMRPCPHIRSGFNWARRTELCLGLPCSLNVWSITVTIFCALGDWVTQGPVHCQPPPLHLLVTFIFSFYWLDTL